MRHVTSVRDPWVAGCLGRAPVPGRGAPVRPPARWLAHPHEVMPTRLPPARLPALLFVASHDLGSPLRGSILERSLPPFPLFVVACASRHASVGLPDVGGTAAAVGRGVHRHYTFLVLHTVQYTVYGYPVHTVYCTIQVQRYRILYIILYSYNDTVY